MLEKIKNWLLNHRDMSIFLLLCLIALVGQLFSGQTHKEVLPDKQETTYDTYIPEGFSLVPIEVANIESLDALLGPYGVVDLFTAVTPQNPKSEKIASKMKIVRAPKNPQFFAVLVPFKDVDKIMSVSGPFIVSVLNPKSQGGGVERAKQRRSSRIGYNL